MNKPISPPTPLFTLRDLSTLLHVPISRVARAVNRGVIQADFEARAVKLFRSSRLPAIARQIGKH